MPQISIAVVLLAVLAFLGCEGGGGKSRAPRKDTRLVAKVVARVGGRAIGASDVEARMAADGVNAGEALEELIDEELLVQEASRLGYKEGRADERALERLMVRSMLRDFETELTPDSISDEEVRDDYAKYADRLNTPERRRSWHILVKGSKEAERALADSILQELREAKEPRAVFERYAEGAGDEDAPEVMAEDLPAITRQAGFQKPYKNAIFEAESEGLLKKPIQTSYGWHVIYLAEIIPEERRTLNDAESEIRERLSEKKRFERVFQTVQQHEKQGLVQYNELGVERLLSMAGLPERAK